MSLPPVVVLLFLNWFGLIFGSFILFVYGVKIVKGGSVSVFTAAAVCAVVAWCIVCLIS